LTNFSNDKQTQESLESGFPETTFRKTNTAKRENTFLETKPNFSLTGKCFSLTNFSNDKQTRESLKSGFPKNKFQETNITLIPFLSSPYFSISPPLLFFLLEYIILLIDKSNFKGQKWAESTREL
jgi:hypothetical protein